MKGIIIKNRLLFLFAVLVLLVIALIGFHFLEKNRMNNKKNTDISIKKDKDLDNNDNNMDYDNRSTTTPDNKQGFVTKKVLDVIEDTDPLEEKRPILEEDLKLVKITDNYSYFVVKQCLTSFYSSKENAYNELDSNLKKYDISTFYKEMRNFCIDEIYGASIRLTKDVYFVYYRETTENNTVINKQIIIKIDTNNAAFYVYPYEYLKSIDYLNLKEDDSVLLEIIDTSDIERTDNNIFNQSLVKNGESSCIREYFERFKFDLNYDLEHLYNTIDEEYKKVRFENDFQKFTNFINNKKQMYMADILKGFNKYDYNWYTQYVLACNSDNRFIFNVLNIMDYSIQFDNYTTVVSGYSTLYYSIFPHTRAKYCMDRVRRAINDQNYDFVYSKLNSVQKRNYYSNYNDFVKFIQVYFYQLNIFEYGKYKEISDNVFQYKVKVKDEMNEQSSRNFEMTVTLKDNCDFEITIKL